MSVNAIEIRDVERTVECYNVFKEMHENLSYSDSNSKLEVPRAPIIKSFEQYQKTLEQTNIYFIVYFCNIIGYIIMDAYDDTCKIQEMCIKPEYRRKGYGRMAIHELISQLKEKEFKVVQVVSATMGTDDFYTSCRFQWKSGDTYEYRL
jgi:ribosomal protein S18 acetylase RimI-like enzyme